MRASATIACRALVMLGCLVVIPLAAVSGSSLTTWVDTALEGKWPWADRSATANQSDPRFELMSPDEAVWPDNLRPPAQVARPVGARTAGGPMAGTSGPDQWPRPAKTPGMQGLGSAGTGGIGPAEVAQAARAGTSRVDRAVVPTDWGAAVVCQDGVCRLVGATGASQGTPGTFPTDASASHSPAQTASPYHGPAGSEPLCLAQTSAEPDRSAQAWIPSGLTAAHLSDGAGTPLPDRSVAPAPALKGPAEDRFTRLGSRLQRLGATYYLLEHWGNGQYRFYCRMAIAGNPRLTQNFEQIDADPLKAMTRVVEQVEAWRTTVP